EAEGLGGLEIDHQLELRGLLERKIRGLRPFEDSVHVDGSSPEEIDGIGSKIQEASRLDEPPAQTGGGYPLRLRELDETRIVVLDRRGNLQDEGLGPFTSDYRE